MKRIFLLVSVAIAFSLTACGPNAEEQAAAEKRIQDSLEQVRLEEEARLAQEEADRLAEEARLAEEEAARLQAEADAAAKKSGTKSSGSKTPVTKTPEKEPEKEGKLNVKGDSEKGGGKLDVKGEEGGSKKLKVN
jgi:membrane protein involved in colicin uptake